MYKNLVIMFLFITISFCQSATFVNADEIAPPAPEKQDLILPAGTPLELVLVEEIYSQRNAVGDEILFLLKEDLVLMGQTYLVKNTPVFGRITKAKAGKSWGRSGSLEIEVFSIAPPYGMPISLAEEFGKTQGSKAGKTILGIAAFGILWGGAIKGKKITIPAGKEVTMFTSIEGKIANIPLDEMRQMTDEWIRNKIIDNFLSFTWKNKCTVEQAITKMNYTVEPENIEITPIEDYRYRIDVALDSQHAIFIFRPFDEVHDGGTGFKPLKAENELAEKVMKSVK
ncbi:hypothetical protein J7L05_10070 [bacterium]|nr:hypothetical protein [bacterium]